MMKLQNEHSIVYFTIGVLFAIITEKTFCQESRLDHLKFRHKSRVISDMRLHLRSKDDIRCLPVLTHDPMHMHRNESLLPHEYYFDRLSDHLSNPFGLYLTDRNFDTTKKYSMDSPMGVREEWVRTYESRTLPSYDAATALAVDKEGNVYVAGYSTNMPRGMDFCTIKYNADGNQIWIVYFNGEANGDDLAWKIVLDDMGNVYVGGNSTGSVTGYDIVIVKYNSQGHQQWDYCYNGLINKDDTLEDMAIDYMGNIYLTGRSNHRFITVKLNNNGIQQWASQYTGPADHADPIAMDIDKQGNVYVTGASDKVEEGNYTDYTTVKYNPEGIQQWEAQFIASDSSYDYPRDIEVDEAGNVYVAGSYDIYNNSNYLIIKYDSNGQELWAATYDGNANTKTEDYVADLMLDDDGNVYVTGSSQKLSGHNHHNIVTIKYDSEGVQQWATRYGREGDNYALAVGMDSSGNIYVSGYKSRYEYLAIKYDLDGNQLWATSYDIQSNYSVYPSSSAITNKGEIFITGNTYGSETDSDNITVKCNRDGFYEWDARFNGNNREEGGATDLFVDDNGNIYVTGYSNDNNVTIKYNSRGIQVWNADYCVRDFEYVRYSSMAVDHLSNVFITCPDRQDSTEWNYDFVTIKYDAHGDQKWVVRYDKEERQDANNRHNIPKAITVDQKGNIYVAGNSRGKGHGQDIVTIKYNSQGVEQWVNRYPLVEDKYVEFSDMVIDSEGNVYVTGFLLSDVSRLVTIKYNSRGEQKWIKMYDGPGRVFRSLMAADDWNNIYLMSNQHMNSTLNSAMTDIYDCFILKYNSDGINQWVVQCSGSGDPIIGADIGVDVVGNVYVCGYIWDNFQFITKKYNTDGVALWTARCEYADYFCYADCLVLDNECNVYVAGCINNGGTGLDVLLEKYNPQGKERWIINYNDPRNTHDFAKKLAVDVSGNVYVAGSTHGKFWSNLKTIKFSQTGEDSAMFHSSASDYQLNQNIPNPFNKQTLIYYSLPRSCRVKFMVFNSVGQRVAYEDLGQKSSGHHAFHFMSDQLSTGIYFYRMEANDFIKTRKMIVIQ